MYIVYLVALLLGVGLGSLVLFLALGGAGDDRMPLKGYVLAGMGVVCAGYSLMQMMRPAPRRNGSGTGSN
jgi:hypothetical protein